MGKECSQKGGLLSTVSRSKITIHDGCTIPRTNKESSGVRQLRWLAGLQFASELAETCRKKTWDRTLTHLGRKALNLHYALWSEPWTLNRAFGSLVGGPANPDRTIITSSDPYNEAKAPKRLRTSVTSGEDSRSSSRGPSSKGVAGGAE